MSTTAMYNKRKRSRRGFTMIEIMLVLAVMGLLTAAIIVIGGKLRESSNIRSESSNLAMLNTAIQSAFSGIGSYDQLEDDGNSIITRYNSFPATMVVKSGSGQNYNKIGSVWNRSGSVVVASETYPTSGGVDGQAYSITYSDVPSESCTEFVSSNMTAFYRVDVGSKTVRDVSPGASETGDLAALGSGCGNNSNVDISFFNR